MIALAIAASRPCGEQWLVSIYDDGTVLRVDFARGTDEALSLSFAMARDEVEHTAFYPIVCQFLRRRWPGGVTPS